MMRASGMTKQEWRAAFEAAYSVGSDELGMGHRAAEAFAKKMVGEWVDHAEPAGRIAPALAAPVPAPLSALEPSRASTTPVAAEPKPTQPPPPPSAAPNPEPVQKPATPAATSPAQPKPLETLPTVAIMPAATAIGANVGIEVETKNLGKVAPVPVPAPADQAVATPAKAPQAHQTQAGHVAVSPMAVAPVAPRVAGPASAPPPAPTSRHVVDSAPAPGIGATAQGMGGRKARFAMASMGVAITAVYCAAEICYNMSLVEFLSSANTSVDAFENLERVGKALGAIGLSMVASKLFLKGKKAAAMFAVLAPLAYLGIDRGFDAYIDGLPQAAKVEGYYLGAYRSLIIGGQLKDADFGGESRSIEDKIKLLNLPLAAAAGKDPQGKVSAFVFGSDDPHGFDKEIAALWDVHSAMGRKIEPMYGYYAIESRKISEHKIFHDRYAAAFTKKSGGIPPGLSKDEFNAAVQKQYPSLAAYRQTVAIPARPAIGMPALTMGDVPPGLDQAGFEAFFHAHIEKARSARADKSVDVERLAQSKNLISSSLVPPLSMGLSLLSFGLNLAMALAGAASLALWPIRETKLGAAAILAAKAGFAAAILGWMATRPPALSGAARQWQEAAASSSLAGAAWSKAIDAEGAVLALAAPALPAIHRAFIDDSHPERVQRVTVEKAQAVDLAGLDQRIAEFKSAAEADDTPGVVDPTFHADESKLDQKDYYGETRPTGGNPYVKKK